MKITARLEGSRLAVDVEHTNSLEEPLYIKHWLLDWYGLLGIPEMNAVTSPHTARWTPELAFVCIGAPSEVVLFSGDGPKPPLGINVYAPRVPESTRLLPKQTFRGTVRLPLPLREWHAYDGLDIDPVRPVVVTQLRYRLETIAESACSRQPVRELPNAPGVFRAYGHPVEILEASVPLPEPITVLQRTDHFERFA